LVFPLIASQAHSRPNLGGKSGAKPKLYNARHPERTLVYQTIAEHFSVTFDTTQPSAWHPCIGMPHGETFWIFMGNSLEI
jgi:hypothetical protein